MNTRVEHDSMGEIEVPTDRYWGAQTQRSYQNFKISDEKMPFAVIYAFAHLKMAAAKVNLKNGTLNEEKAEMILRVCDEILTGKLDEHFPLSVWQTGSGTQSNMNVNEVIANRGNHLAGKKLLHPNDDVNQSQSSNDTFPSAMHIAAVTVLQKEVLPEINEMILCMKQLEKEYHDIIKIGRTHLQDATPLRFSDEISGWRGMLENNVDMLQKAIDSLGKLAIGGTAVGTGLNAPEHFDEDVSAQLSQQLAMSFIADPNKMTMCAVQVMGNDATIGFAASQGNFELNVFMPVIIYNFLQSCTLMCDALRSFRIHCVAGLQPNQEKMEAYLQQSLMLVTALNPYIGYEKAAKTARYAYENNLTLKAACLHLGYLDEEQFDRYVDAKKMVK